jgi:hypothetical protein
MARICHESDHSSTALRSYASWTLEAWRYDPRSYRFYGVRTELMIYGIMIYGVTSYGIMVYDVTIYDIMNIEGKAL